MTHGARDEQLPGHSGLTDSCPAASPRLWLNSSGEASHSELPVMYCTLTSSWLLAPGLNLTMLPTEYPVVDTTRTFLSPALCDPDVSADAETVSPTPLAGLLWSLAPCWPYNADGSSCTPMGSMVPSGAGAVVARAPPASISARSTRRAIVCGRGAKSVGPRGRKESTGHLAEGGPRALGPPLWAPSRPSALQAGRPQAASQAGATRGCGHKARDYNNREEN